MGGIGFWRTSGDTSSEPTFFERARFCRFTRLEDPELVSSFFAPWFCLFWDTIHGRRSWYRLKELTWAGFKCLKADVGW